MKFSTSFAILFGVAVAAVPGVVSAESLRGNQLKEDSFFPNEDSNLRYEDALDSEDVFSYSKSGDYEDEDVEKFDPEDLAPEDVAVTVFGFDSGLSFGKDTANSIWRRLGNRCSSAWKTFPESINREISNRGWNSRNGDWRTKAYNEGARAGMQQVLKEKEKQCFNDSATECIDLATEAARIIAYRHCNLMSINHKPNFRATCRDVAINQCKGEVTVQLKKECGIPSTSVLSNLQNQCKNTVKELIGDRAEEKFVAEV